MSEVRGTFGEINSKIRLETSENQILIGVFKNLWQVSSRHHPVTRDRHPT